MKIKSEFFEIAKGVVDENGVKLEPEQQPALIIQNIEGGADATIARGTQSVGSIPLQIARATTAGDLATQHGQRCHLCKGWDCTRWNRLIREAAEGVGSPEDLQAVNDVRAAIISSGNASLSEQFEGEDGDMDVEQALHAMGICWPLTEHERATDPNMGPKELVVTFPRACCPTSVVTPSSPQGFFKPRDAEAAEAAGMNRDAVLMAAANMEKKP